MGLKKVPILNGVEQADIALVLEGTYPYIRGGVSSWVHQIIVGLPQFTFALIFLGDLEDNYNEIKYELPNNVVSLTCFFIMETESNTKPIAKKGNKKQLEKIKTMHQNFQQGNNIDFSNIIARLIMGYGNCRPITHDDFLFSEEAWKFITEQYEDNTSEASFLSYFWTIRMLHIPIFSLIDAIKEIPDACIYHTISTGYAGLFCAMIKSIKQRPTILTEHGIYTKERKIELSQATWIQDVDETFKTGLIENYSYLRLLWIRFFKTAAKITYDSSDLIISISSNNISHQVSDGADPEKIILIPNGVNLNSFKVTRDSRPNKAPPVIGFIGRVVPIKDVKTFIRAIGSVSIKLPEIKAWIVGGEDEDPKYASECRDLVTSLGLEDVIIYKGFCNVSEIMKDIGVVVLSSISEGLPLVILEAFASGRPCVTTDVGACRELIEGDSNEDKDLGMAGAVVDIADSEILAQEIINLFLDDEYWQQACSSAVQRVEKYFNEDALFQNYQSVYQRALKEQF